MKRTLAGGVVLAAAPAAAGRRVSATDRVGVGFIGAGARAQQLIETIQEVNGVEVVALCDAYTGRAARARSRTGDRATIAAGYRELLATPGIDAVVISTPDHWHHAMTIAALEAGKDVYVEKPMTYTVEEGLSIIDAVKRTGRVLQVGSQGISSALQQKAREIVKSGRLGQITMVRASYNRNTPGGAWIYPIPPDASPKTIDWDAFLGSAPKRPFDAARFFRWRCYWDYSGGIATDLFVHLTTTLHYVLDARMPETVLASGQLYRWKDTHEVPDTVNAVLIYPEGFVANLSSTLNNESSSESGFEILGTEGTLTFRGGSLIFTPEQAYDNNRWVVESWPEALERAYYADPKVQARESPHSWRPEMKAGSETWREWGWDSTRAHLEAFIRAVRSREQPIEDATAGHHTASCAHLVNASLRRKTPVQWDFSASRART